YVTHDQVEAMTMADRIVVINNGNIEQVGTPLELYDRPENKFVAGFLGSPAMNFFEGRLDNANGRFVLGKHSIALRTPLRNAPSDPIILGVRPEHMIMDPEGLPAEVIVVEPT